MSTQVSGRPTKIMIIRHAEKPPASATPGGVAPDGKEDPNSLTVRGWQRAGALVRFFAPADGVFADPHLAKPTSLYAIRTEPGHSRRSQETITPLKDALASEMGIYWNTNFEKRQEQDLVTSVLGRSGVVLICWQHEHIPDIFMYIPLKGSAPTTWAEDRFDLVWVLDLDLATGSYEFSETQQQLLPGDLQRQA